ncbi:MAG: iron-containing alcohol dehydrogenase family protein [Patescibacteria group bacterium]
MPVKPSLAFSTEVYIGAGCRKDLPGIVRPFGRRVLLVTGEGPLLQKAEALAASLIEAGLETVVLPAVAAEPTLETVERVIAAAREAEAEVLVGLGGGSCLDTAKAAAGIAPTGRETAVFFGGAEADAPGLPWVAVPTTAGSGAEVTPNAVLIDPSTRVKQSIRSRFFAARAAVVDPELALDLPPAQTAYSGMDALSHAVEAFTSRGANDLTDILALEAARLIVEALPRAHRDGADLEARAALAKASLIAGIALANARLGAVHGLAHPIGSLYGLPHGLVCAVLLPHVMRLNLRVSYAKYARLAEAWGAASSGDIFDRAAAAIRHLLGLNRRLGIPANLAGLGLVEKDLAWIVEQTLPSGSLAANPRPLDRGELIEALRENLG